MIATPPDNRRNGPRRPLRQRAPLFVCKCNKVIFGLFGLLLPTFPRSKSERLHEEALKHRRTRWVGEHTWALGLRRQSRRVRQTGEETNVKREPSTRLTVGKVGVGGKARIELQLALIVISRAKCCFFTHEHSELFQHLVVKTMEWNLFLDSIWSTQHTSAHLEWVTKPVVESTFTHSNQLLVH